MSAVAHESRVRPAAAAQPARAAARVQWVNAAKGVGIILVVFGHVGRGVIDHDAARAGIAASAAAIHQYACADNAMYAFHMALFFFLSGLFVERGAQKSTVTFFGQKLQTIVYPYFLWAIIQCLFVAAAGGNANSHVSPRSVILKLPYEPFAQFWFLYTLMVCMTLFWALYRLKLNRAVIFVLAAAAYFFGSLLHLSSWNPAFATLSDWTVLYQTRMYFIYFAAGAWLAPTVLQPVTKIPAVVLGLLGAALLALEYWLAKDFYATHVPENLRWLGAFATAHRLEARDWVGILPAVAGIAGTYALALGIVRLRLSGLLEWLGELTLPIYVAQVIAAAAARVALQKVLHVHELWIHLVVGTVAGLAVPVLLDVLARRVGFNYLFSFGSTAPVRKS